MINIEYDETEMNFKQGFTCAVLFVVHLYFTPLSLVITPHYP
jgi:hypothetical protein